MRTIVSSALAALVVSTVVASPVAAQESRSAVLNTLEVQRLVTHAEPGDYARLAAHFGALADRYTAEAKRHTSMAASFVGNPSRNLGTSMSAHCKRLADLNMQSAATVRELAAYHEKLASGSAAPPLREGARFESGAGAPEPTERELNALAAKARTPAEHGALQEYFLTLAKRYTAEANEQASLAQTYRGTRIAQAAVQHERLATLSRDSAKEANEAARMHQDLAGSAR